MKVINLDKFRRKTIVELDGTEYTVRGMNFEEFLAEIDLDENMTPRARFERQVSVVATMSNIPVDVLKKQEMGVITALLQVAQGVEPTEPADENAEGNAE